jgi:hypothetical protein
VGKDYTVIQISVLLLSLNVVYLLHLLQPLHIDLLIVRLSHLETKPDTFTHRMGKSKTLEPDPYTFICDSMAAPRGKVRSSQPNNAGRDRHISFFKSTAPFKPTSRLLTPFGLNVVRGRSRPSQQPAPKITIVVALSWSISSLEGTRTKADHCIGFSRKFLYAPLRLSLNSPMTSYATMCLSGRIEERIRSRCVATQMVSLIDALCMGSHSGRAKPVKRKAPSTAYCQHPHWERGGEERRGDERIPPRV